MLQSPSKNETETDRRSRARSVSKSARSASPEDTDNRFAFDTVLDCLLSLLAPLIRRSRHSALYKLSWNLNCLCFMFNCLCNLAPSYLMNMCQASYKQTFIDAVCVLPCMATSSFHRRRQSVSVHTALLSLDRQREMCYIMHHYAKTNSLPCHFVASWRLNYTLEHIIHTSTLVTVFTVRASGRT